MGAWGRRASQFQECLSTVSGGGWGARRARLPPTPHPRPPAMPKEEAAWPLACCGCFSQVQEARALLRFPDRRRYSNAFTYCMCRSVLPA